MLEGLFSLRLRRQSLVVGEHHMAALELFLSETNDLRLPFRSDGASNVSDVGPHDLTLARVSCIL